MLKIITSSCVGSSANVFSAYGSTFYVFFFFYRSAYLDVYFTLTFDLTLFTKVLAGLKEGMLWAGMIMVVFLEMFLPVFAARFLIMKLPKPLK